MSEEQPINIAQASAEVGNLVRMFKGVRDAQLVIDALAQAEQQQAELRRSITTAKANLTRAQNEVDDAKTEAGRIRDEASFTLQAAQAERERVLADARVEADAVLAAAAEQKQALEDEAVMIRRDLDGLRQQVGLVKGELGRLESARKAVLTALTGAQARAVDVPPSVDEASVPDPIVTPSE